MQKSNKSYNGKKARKQCLRRGTVRSALEGLGFEPTKDLSFNIAKTAKGLLIFAATCNAFWPTPISEQTITWTTNNTGINVQTQVLGKNNIQINNIEISTNHTNTDCEFRICDKFADETKWTTHPNLNFTVTEPPEIEVVLDGNQRVGEIYYKELWLKPEFSAIFTVTPCGAKEANTRILLGHTRLSLRAPLWWRGNLKLLINNGIASSRTPRNDTKNDQTRKS